MKNNPYANRFKSDLEPSKGKLSIQLTSQPPVRISYNEWFAFIHRIKPIENTVKVGGVCLNWVMEKTLEEAKRLL